MAARQPLTLRNRDVLHSRASRPGRPAYRTTSAPLSGFPASADYRTAAPLAARGSSAPRARNTARNIRSAPPSPGVGDARGLDKRTDRIPADAIYCGRPPPLGNQFIIARRGTRDEVCDKYEPWLADEPTLVPCCPAWPAASSYAFARHRAAIAKA